MTAVPSAAIPSAATDTAVMQTPIMFCLLPTHPMLRDRTSTSRPSSHRFGYLSAVAWVIGWVLMIGWVMLPSFPALAEPAPQSELQAEPIIEPLPRSFNLQAEDISSEKVSQFVHAYLQVLNLIEQREGDLQSAETQLESLRVQQEIETDAFAMIESSGLTWQEYLQLLGLANTDAEFGERVVNQLQEAA
ncbi:DUF4168 domain-containing protein [Leptolyngbya sp. AN02str]|uniref:DUF4168 domain-containing protein n=1 Tax=Leptolyngbya sp. AN02str TaxID=3423363 RepID=UPI003D31F91E